MVFTRKPWPNGLASQHKLANQNLRTHLRWWPNGFASRLESSRKSQKASHQISHTCRCLAMKFCWGGVRWVAIRWKTCVDLRMTFSSTKLNANQTPVENLRVRWAFCWPKSEIWIMIEFGASIHEERTDVSQRQLRWRSVNTLTVTELSNSSRHLAYQHSNCWSDILHQFTCYQGMRVSNPKNSGYSLLGPALKSTQRRICLNFLPWPILLKNR